MRTFYLFQAILIASYAYAGTFSIFKCSTRSLKKIARPINSASPQIARIDSCLTDHERAYLKSNPTDIYYFGEHVFKWKRTMMDKHNWNLRRGSHFAFRYEIMGKLGKGAFGSVYKVFDHKDGNEFALKTATQDNEAELENEYQIVQEMFQSPEKDKFGGLRFILRPIAYLEDHNRKAIIYPLRSGSLKDLLMTNPKITFEGLQWLAFSVTSALTAMQANFIAHEDMHRGNILVSSKTGITKSLDTSTQFEVSDFGAARHFQLGSWDNHFARSDLVHMCNILSSIFRERVSSNGKMNSFTGLQEKMLQDFLHKCFREKMTPAQAMEHPLFSSLPMT